MATPYPEGGPPSGAPGGKTTIGLESNVGAALCYLANFICCIGLVLAIVFLVTEKENRFVKLIAGMKAYGGQWYKLPIIGEFAWNTVNK
jgi:uncharacterized membrane protein